MDFMPLIEARYSVRRFSPRQVEQDKLDTILRAGMLAPTAVARQPQKLLVLRSAEALEKLKGCTASHFDCTLAVIVCYDPALSWKRRFDGQDSGWVDASIVTDHMMLAATELGVGSTWVMSFDPAALREAFAIPEALVPVSILVMGYPADDAAPGSLHGRCKPLDEVVRYDSY